MCVWERGGGCYSAFLGSSWWADPPSSGTQAFLDKGAVLSRADKTRRDSEAGIQDMLGMFSLMYLLIYLCFHFACCCCVAGKVAGSWKG